MATNGVNTAPELLAAVDAVRGAIDDAQRQLERTAYLKRAITAMAVAALRQRDLDDASIQNLLDLDAGAMTAAADPPGPIADGAPDWELRGDIERVWMAVRRQASAWLQTDDVTTSAQVVGRNAIDTGSWPLAVRALDTPGAEFVHQTSGQKIVVYSLQGRDGTPSIVNDAIDSWDYAGRYDVEFVSPYGLRSPLDLSSFGVLSSALAFRRRSDREAQLSRAFPSAARWVTGSRNAAGAFGPIVAAIRRMCGPLPPYHEAAADLSADGPGSA